MEARTRLARVGRAVVQLLAWAAAGITITLLVAWWLSPRWVDFCSGLSDQADPCAPIEVGRMIGYVSTAIGLLLMTIGPVVTTLWKLFRHGYDWETSHVEPAHVNVPIVFGIAHFIGGMIVVGMA